MESLIKHRAYEDGIAPKRGDVVHIRQLSMLSHDGWGGAMILGQLIEQGASVVLDEYGITVAANDPLPFVKLMGPCMTMMILRHQEEQTKRQ